MGVEKISELSKICQKPNYKSVGNWMVRYFERDAAVYITWLVLHTPISANQVTAFSLIVAVLGGVLVATGNGTSFLIGTLFLQFWYLLDHVDGQVARYRKTASIDGVFYDFMMHHIVNFVPFFALGWRLYYLTQDSWAVFLGYLASISTALIAVLNDCKAKAIYCNLVKLEEPPVLKVKRAQAVGNTESLALFKRVFSVMHKSCEIHVLMNVLTLFSILYVAAEKSGHFELAEFGLWVILVYYCCVSSAVWMLRLYYQLKMKSVSTEYFNVFANRTSGDNL